MSSLSGVKSLSKAGRSQSAAFLEACGNNGHSFARKTYHRPTYCHHCTDLLWGLTNQGLQCSVCNFVSHQKCLFYITTPCHYLASTLIKDPVGHNWCSSTYLRRKFCNVCRKLLNDSSDYSCEVCEYYVHKECKDSAINNCKRSATYSLKQKKGEQEHKWQEGNLPSGSKCAFCKKSCSTSECLASVKCKWCNTTAHSGCFTKVKKVCDFGDFSRLMLPPFAVCVPNLALWRKISNEVTENTQHVTGEISDEVLLSEHLNSEDESLVTSPSDSDYSSDATNSVNVYDGKIESPRMYKVVHVSRTTPAIQVLQEALRLYQITDDPENYYLTKTLDQFSERTIEAHEMPLQFPNRNKRPMIFLRIKNADKSGHIRVYMYLSMERKGTTFKTLKVQATTNVEEVIRKTLEKFAIQGKKAEDFSLVITHLFDGVKERVMQVDECPWKVLTDMKRRSIREMKFTRFYLRPKYEPLSSAILCVSNLPPMLGHDAYYSFLKEHIQHDEFTVDASYPSSGTVFLGFNSSDKASRAMTELQDATLSGKNLFVKLIPNIHVDALNDKSQPLLVLVNARSGGGQGVELLSAFQKQLNLHQVYSLSEGGPLPGLYAFRHLESFRILVCGGDGTVGWVLSSLDECSKNLSCREPPVAIVPLGTGNDLSRVLRWGAGYSDSEDPFALLMATDQAETTSLDRWLIIFESSDNSDTAATPEGSEACEDLPNSFVMNNYFGIGIDAAVSLDFHLAREEAPEKFTSRLHNKSVYFRVGLRNMVRKSTSFNENIEIQVDGNLIELPSIEGIVVLNIASWGAGCDAWGPNRDDKFSPASCRDNLLEVLGVTGVMHMGQMKSGIRSGIRLGQGSQINITLKSDLPVHVDGEPWYQPPGKIVIRPMLTQAKMLIKRSKSKPSKPDEAGKMLVSSTFYSFDEGGALMHCSEEKV